MGASKIGHIIKSPIMLAYAIAVSPLIAIMWRLDPRWTRDGFVKMLVNAEINAINGAVDRFIDRLPVRDMDQKRRVMVAVAAEAIEAGKFEYLGVINAVWWTCPGLRREVISEATAILQHRLTHYLRGTTSRLEEIR